MSDRNGSPWPAPQSPPTRSLTWPAPQPSRDAIVPGSIVRSRYGAGRKARVTEAGPSLLTYRLLDDEDAGDFTMYAEMAEHARGRKVNSARPAPRPTRKLRTTPVSGERVTLKARWDAWRTRRQLGNKRKSIDLTLRDWRTGPLVTNRDRWLDFLLPGLTKASDRIDGRRTSAHTAACDRRCATKGGKVDHRSRRTPGCPGCKALR